MVLLRRLVLPVAVSVSSSLLDVNVVWMSRMKGRMMGMHWTMIVPATSDEYLCVRSERQLDDHDLDLSYRMIDGKSGGLQTDQMLDMPFRHMYDESCLCMSAVSFHPVRIAIRLVSIVFHVVFLGLFIVKAEVELTSDNSDNHS